MAIVPAGKVDYREIDLPCPAVFSGCRLSRAALDQNFLPNVGSLNDPDRCWTGKWPSCSGKSNAVEPASDPLGAPRVPGLFFVDPSRAEPRTASWSSQIRPFQTFGHIKRPFHLNLRQRQLKMPWGSPRCGMSMMVSCELSDFPAQRRIFPEHERGFRTSPDNPSH
jgi:hypothetical protein